MRRLGDFSVCDEAGISEPLEAVEFAQGKLFLSGAICWKPCLTICCSGLTARMACVGCLVSVCPRVPVDGSSLPGSLLGSGQTFSCPDQAHSSHPPCLPHHRRGLPQGWPREQGDGPPLRALRPPHLLLPRSHRQEGGAGAPPPNKIFACCIVHAVAGHALLPLHAVLWAGMQPRSAPPSSWQVVAATAEGQYVLTRPAAAYKKVYTPLAEKAAICFEVSSAMPKFVAAAAHRPRNSVC